MQHTDQTRMQRFFGHPEPSRWLSLLETGLPNKMYEELRKGVGWEQNPPANVILHAASFDNSGNICVADIWESGHDLDEYFNTKIKPVMERLNAPMPKREIFQVHNINASGALTHIRSNRSLHDWCGTMFIEYGTAFRLYALHDCGLLALIRL